MMTRRVAGMLAVTVLTTAISISAYEIGHVTLNLVDSARDDRPVPTEVYYPSDVPGEEVPVALPPEAGFPVLAFGHGFVISVDDYRFVWEGLVPEGYVVALPRTETGLTPSHLDLGLDLAFAGNELLAAGEDPASPFFGAIAATRGVGGHSMGGGASFLAMASAPGITALFNFAAAETSPSAIAAASQITAPALLFGGSLDCVTPPPTHQLPMYEALNSGCRTYAELQGASHCQFAEYNVWCNLGELGCPPPTMSRDQQHQLTLGLLRPWLDHFLCGDLDAWAEFQALLASQPEVSSLQDCGAAVAAGSANRRFPDVRLTVSSRKPASSQANFVVESRVGGTFALSIYDVSGRRLRGLTLRQSGAGRHEFAWDGTDDRQRPVATGCYLCRLDSHPACAPVRVLVIR